MIKNLSLYEQPRIKAEVYGVRSLSSVELLSILLTSGSKENDVYDVSKALIEHAKSLCQLSQMCLQEIVQVKGIGKAKALQILAAFELSRRACLQAVQTKQKLDTPQQVIQWLQMEIGTNSQECFLVMYLDRHLCLLHYEILFVGTLSYVNVAPREVFKRALLCNASQLIFVHNHPSGICEISKDDIQVTEKLVKVAKFMQMQIIDHLVVSVNDYKSMSECGLMPK